ncbi:hypothetical protein H920_03133 [Fukomys damarensis]|uniref:Uncharacterized protein n=1 Tax=Fukomys damarensis TaxID=885580 RepID=A0A091DYG1_FUKDA|nr:hypothetical protein H920_03133 [Fukomys damarensis]
MEEVGFELESEWLCGALQRDLELGSNKPASRNVNPTYSFALVRGRLAKERNGAPPGVKATNSKWPLSLPLVALNVMRQG